MGRINRPFVFGLLIFQLLCCGNKHFNKPEDYLQWINNPDNGLVQKKKVNRLILKIKYLPHKYLLLIENEEASSKEIEAMLQTRKSDGLSFLLTISPDLKDDGDIMFRGVSSLKEFNERVLQMNFNIGQSISLVLDHKVYNSVLSNLENTYSLNKGRNINLLFDITLEELRQSKDSKLDVKYVDEIFNTGIHHFLFDARDILRIP